MDEHPGLDLTAVLKQRRTATEVDLSAVASGEIQRYRGVHGARQFLHKAPHRRVAAAKSLTLEGRENSRRKDPIGHPCQHLIAIALDPGRHCRLHRMRQPFMQHTSVRHGPRQPALRVRQRPQLGALVAPHQPQLSDLPIAHS